MKWEERKPFWGYTKLPDRCVRGFGEPEAGEEGKKKNWNPRDDEETPVKIRIGRVQTFPGWRGGKKTKKNVRGKGKTISGNHQEEWSW